LNKLFKMTLQRLLIGALILWIVSLIVSLGFSLMAGDVATEMLGQSATPETVAALRRSLGLDLSLAVRYVHWLTALLHGDLGRSLTSHRQIIELVTPRLANTVFLAFVTAVVAVPLALALGILAALFRHSIFDRVINVIALACASLPEFFVAYVLIMFVSVKLRWLPSLSNVSASDPWTHRLYAVALPASTLTLVIVAHMMRMTRASIINVLASPYIEMATIKGMSRARIIYYHALPNALAPIINIVVVNLSYLLVGTVVVEVVFVYPGLGQLMVDSVQKRDIPVVQACSLVFAGGYILLNLTADLLSIMTNPRLMHPK
jgi:peptide/nickel transport system permease protein